MKKTLLMAGAAIMSLTLPAGHAAAQDAAADQGPQSEAEARQETIVITGRKKEEALLDAPVAVTAFDAASITNLQLESVDDIARFTSGLSFSKAFGRSTERPVVRGQSNVLAGVQFGVESGTAYFIDGVYYSGSIQNLDPNDLARVEVIKGPQSALYGRNTYAGAINFITRGGADKFEGAAKLRVGTNGTSEAALTLAGPLFEGLTGRLSYRGYEYGGEHGNAVTKENVGDESTISVSGVIDWKPTETFDLRIRTSYNKDEDGPLPIFLQPAAQNNCLPGYRSLRFWALSGSTNTNQYYCGVIRPGKVALNTGPDADGVRNLVNGVPLNATLSFAPQPYSLADGTAFDGLYRELYVTTLNANYNIGGSGWIISLLGGYSDEVLLTGFDSDHSSVNWFVSGPNAEPFFANTTRDDIVDYSAELQLRTPEDNRLRAMIGLYLYDQLANDSELTFAKPRGPAAPFSKRTTRNEAVFGLIEADLTSRVSVTLEGRYAEETKTDTTSTVTPRVSYDKFTPRVTVDYDLNNGGTIYAVYAQGVKPGGINGALGQAVGMPTYDQEESDNYEIGLKTPFSLGGNSAFNLAASAYFIDATKVQVTNAVASPLGAVNSIATNQGAAEIKGIEIDASGSLNDIVSGGISYAWTDPKFTKGCDPDQWILTSGGGLFNNPSAQTGVNFTSAFPGSGPATCNIAGNRLPLTSEHQAAAFLRLDFNEAGPFESDFFISGDVTYESSKFVQVHNKAETGDATLIGGRLGFETDGWTFSVYGQNIGDEDSIVMATRWLQVPYFITAFSPNTAPTTASRSAPRAFFGTLRRGPQFGAELRLRF